MINRDTQKYEHYLMIKRDTKSNVILPNDKETQTYVTWWPNDKQGYKKIYKKIAFKKNTQQIVILFSKK